MRRSAEDTVVDASIAAKWILDDEPYVREALEILSRIRAGDLRLVVPSFWDYKVASILSKAVANGRISESDALLGIEVLQHIPSQRAPYPSPQDAFQAARRFNRSLIDCLYLSLAEMRPCSFWTDDRKLLRAVGPTRAFVKWVGDYPLQG
jgi:predicted nucleic acid-binding protein